MRQSHTFYIEKPSTFSKGLLLKSKEIDYVSILDSNTRVKCSRLPKGYINYDLIVGFDALQLIEIDDNVFNSLSTFHSQHKDWLFGFLSYDIKNECEQLYSRNKDGIEANLASFFIPKYVFILKDNHLVIHTYESKKVCEQFLSSLELCINDKIDKIKLKKRESKEMYIKNIDKIQKHIQRGDIYELNYCQEFFAKEILLHPEAIFSMLNKHTATPFSCYLKIKELYAMCASPERFIRKSAEHLISQPIKGTIKRGKNKIEDDRLIKKLQKSEKDFSENIMITDLVRNDLSVTATTGSVKVIELCEVYTFEKVHQMITTITSEVNKNINFSTILKSIFPMGSMTGAPKIKAMELIEEFESFKRGLFSGAIGYITPSGDFDFNVVIRTILYNSRLKYLSVGVGGAITIRSVAEDEYEECLVKVNPIFEVLKFVLDDK